MNINMQNKWDELYLQSKLKLKYPVETVVQFVFRNFKRDKNTRILDLGCGAGRHIQFMASENIDTYGIDISNEAIEYVKELLKEKKVSATLNVGKTNNIPFADNYFDGLICYGVLYYCKSDEIKEAVEEIYRVLKPNGKGMVVVRTVEDYRYGNGVEIEKNTFIIQETDGNKCAYNENGMVMHFFTKKEIQQLFKVFKNVTIDKIIETHENESFCDSNYIIIFEK